MTHVVTDACIRCKYMDCVESCPTDCFHEGENMLVINASACIDCSICVPECPVDAIQPDIDANAARWVKLNATYAALWPNIARRKAPPADADAWRDVPDKFGTYFSEKPGSAP